MHSYRLTWKSEPPVGVIDASPLRADHLCRLAPSELLAVRLQAGRCTYALGDLYDLVPLPDAPGQQLHLEGSATFHFLAAGQTTGVTTVHGPAGQVAAAGMQGGQLRVHGPTGPRLAAGLRGGLVIVYGDAGEQVGGPLPGAEVGMSGGEVLVLGQAGARAGLSMRRGLIAIAGTAGESAGCGMRAGTLLVGRGKLLSPASGMRRGSVLALDQAEIPPGFRQQGPVQPSYWRLLARHLGHLGFPLPDGTEHWTFDGYNGDYLSLGRGELLCHGRPLASN